ncbi:Endoplasmic reticulum chaperone BiP, partial [Lunasporangiospora selenospora]
VGSSATRLGVIVGKEEPASGHNGEPKIIFIGPGTRSTPAPLESNWTAEGFLLVKDGTDEALYVHPSNTFFNLDLPVAIRSLYEINNRPNIPGYHAFTLIDITAKYLQALVTSAESIVGQNITSVLIVLPDGQNIQTTAEEIVNDGFQGNYTLYDKVDVAGYDSQWPELRMMMKAIKNAMLEYRGTYFEEHRRSLVSFFPFKNDMEYSHGVLVYHLGASRFEVSVYEVDEATSIISSSVYDRHLGGNDFNQRVIDHLLQAHKNKTGQDLYNNDMFLVRLRSEVEKAKRMLSTQDWAQIEIESLQPGGQDFSELLTRSQFEDLNMDLFNRTIATITQVIKDSDEFVKDDIQDIVFSGGSANIPFLQSAIREYFGGHKRYHGLEHPEDTIVLGAAKLGHLSQHKVYNGVVCCFDDLLGPIGIETADGTMFKLGEARAVYRMHTFSTAKDNQDRVAIRVFSGDGKRADQNTLLGGVEITGIAPAPKGVPQIRVKLRAEPCSDNINLKVMDMTSRRTNTSTFQFLSKFDISGEEPQYRMLEKAPSEPESADKIMLLPGY